MNTSRARALLLVCQTFVAAGAFAEAPRIAIAPFAARPGAETGAAQLAESLSEVLAQRGVRVTRLGGPARALRASAQRFREWALSDGADAVVAGDASPAQGGVDAVIELRSGHSGGLLGSWSVAATEDTGSALQKVAADMRDALAATGSAPLDAESSAQRGQAEDDDRESFAGSLRSDDPIAIESDQLDVVEKEGRRHLVFQRNVRVTQGDITLLTDKLDAFYEGGESQPRKLVASGGVEVEQGDRRARCDRATYLRSDQRVVCIGHAQLVQRCDVVRGSRIEFDLERDHLRVIGAASVVLGSEGEQCGGGAS